MGSKLDLLYRLTGSASGPRSGVNPIPLGRRQGFKKEAGDWDGERKGGRELDRKGGRKGSME